MADGARSRSDQGPFSSNGGGQRPQDSSGPSQQPRSGASQRPQTSSSRSGPGQQPRSGPGQQPRSGPGQQPRSGPGQQPRSGPGQRPQTSSSSSGQRPQTSSSSSGQRPQTSSSSSGQRPQTSSSSSGQRPQTSSSSGPGQRPQTSFSSSGPGQRPQTSFSSSGPGQRPQTSFSSSGPGQRPQTSFSSSGPGQRPQTSFSSSGPGQRPQTSFSSSGPGQRPQTSFSGPGQRPQTSSSGPGQRPQTSSSGPGQRPQTSSSGPGQRPQTSSSGPGQRPQTSSSGPGQRPQTSSSGPGQRPQTSSSGPGQRPQTSSSGPGQRPQTSSSSSGPGQRPQTSSSSSGPGQRPQTSSSSSGPGQRPQTSSSSSGPGQRPQTSSSSSGPGQRPPTPSGPGQRPHTSSSGPGQRPHTSSSGPGQRPHTSSSGPGQRPHTSSSGPGQRPHTSFPGQRPPPGPGRRPQTSSGQRPPSGPGQRPPSGASGQSRSSRVRHAAHRKLPFANWEGEHLWLYLRALGFNREIVGSGVRVGPTMFEKPNASAFYVVAHFLFAKLDSLRAAKVFGDCPFSVGVLKATEFRKKCCVWLREIANEDQSQLPKFVPSTLISPGGPKFIHLMYRFARHAVLEDVKRNSIGSYIPFVEALKSTPKDVNMASARCRVASNKLIQILQKENLVIQEYKKKKQLLIKEIKQIKSEYEVLQLKSFKMKQNDQNKNDKTERIQKVRSMWAVIMETITSLTKEKEAVDYVLQGCVGQYVLDGASVVLRVPQLLAHRVENDITYQHWSGNIYEAGKLNFLTVIQLLNEALRTLRDEICQSELTPQLAYIEDINVKCTQALQNLQSIRLKLNQQHYVPRSESISREQEDWEAKWKNFLGLCPFKLMLEQNSQLGLLRASPPHSFHPSEDDDDDSMFYQHLLSFSDIPKSFHEVHNEKVSDALSSVMETATTASRWISSVPSELPKACENRDALIEKNLPIEACKGEEMPVPPKILKKGKDDSAISEVSQNTGDHIVQKESPVKKDNPLKKSSDELAEEIARTVASESPQSDEDKGMTLEDILSSLAFNPFLAKKQIPRTPENLLTEIRSSWRKAVQPDDSDIELPPAKVTREETPVAAGPITQVVADSRLTCSTTPSPVADSDPSLSERKSLLCSTEAKSQKQMRISHIIESPTLETSGMRESERTGEQELKCLGNISVQNVNSGEDLEHSSSCVKRTVNTLGSCSENNSIINVLTSDHFQDSSMDRVLNQNVSPLLSSVSCKASISWILDEAFPEELDSMNTTEFASSDSDFDVTITDVTGDSKGKGDIQESKLDLESLFNAYKALEKTASTSEEELHQAHNGGESLSCTSEKSLKPGKGDELLSRLELFTLDEAFTKSPLPTSLDERKYSLSSLLASCQHLEEMASIVHDVPLSLISKLKDKEQLNEEPDTKEPSSG